MKTKSTLLIFPGIFLALSLVLSGDLLAQTVKKKPAKSTRMPATEKTTGSAQTGSMDEVFKKAFPLVEFDSIKETNIKNVFEVRKDSEIFYFLPDPGVVFIGNIIDKQGRSLTEQRKAEIVTEKAKGLPLDKAVKVGSGKNTVYEFTDPDCPYCRTASAFLSKRTDVTRYIFFLPLPMHPDAENKIKFIFCSEDRAKAYEDAMQGKLDDKKYEKCTKQEAEELLTHHKDISRKMGIRGTPFFIINGKKPIVGADVKEMETALNNPTP